MLPLPGQLAPGHSEAHVPLTPPPHQTPRPVAPLQHSASPCGGYRGRGGVALTPPTPTTPKKPPSVPRAAGQSQLATRCHGTPHRKERKAGDATFVVSASCLAKSHSDTALGTDSGSARPRRHGACPTVHSQSDTHLGGGRAVAKGNQSEEVERSSSARRQWDSANSSVSWRGTVCTIVQQIFAHVKILRFCKFEAF